MARLLIAAILFSASASRAVEEKAPIDIVRPSVIAPASGIRTLPSTQNLGTLTLDKIPGAGEVRPADPALAPQSALQAAAQPQAQAETPEQAAVEAHVPARDLEPVAATTPDERASPKGSDLSREYLELRAQIKAARGKDELGDLSDYKVLFVPGFLSGAFIKLAKTVGKAPRPWHYFGSHMEWLTERRVEHELVAVHTEQSSESNARVIAAAIRASSKPVIIVSHSKGGLDVLHALTAIQEPSLAKVAGWIPIQTPFLGSPGADRVVDNPVSRFWVTHFLEHPTVGGSRKAIARMTTKAAEFWYRTRRKRIARVLEAVPTVAFTSWKQLGFMDLAGEVRHIEARLNLFRNPWLLFSPLLPLALILKGIAGSLSWVAKKSDGLVPAQSARLPEMHFVEVEGIDHFAPVLENASGFDRLESLQALLKMVLRRAKDRAPRGA